MNTVNWVHRKSGHHSARVGWRVARESGLPLKYSDLVNVGSPILSVPNHALGNCHGNPGPFTATSTGKGLQIDHAGPRPLSEACKHALVCVNSTAGLTRAFPRW